MQSANSYARYKVRDWKSVASMMSCPSSRNAMLTACGCVSSADGGQLTPEQGSILLGLRGGCAAEVTLQTVVHDLHSGMKGGQVKPALPRLTPLDRGSGHASTQPPNDTAQ